MDVAAVTDETDKQLAWEARNRFRAGLAAALSAVGLLGFFVLQGVLTSRIPQPSGLQSLERAAQPGNLDGLPSLQVPLFEYLDSHTLLLLVIGIAGFVGYVGLAWSVGFLGVAARGRQPTLKKFALYLPLVGGVLLGVSVLMLQIGRIVLAADFMSSRQTVADAHDVNSGLVGFSQILSALGTITIAAGLVLISLNAMRTGLITRLMGYMGVAAGGLLLLMPGVPVVQIFWIAGLAVLFLGRWPGGDPPAWRTGRAEPWPSNRPAPASPARPSPQPASAPAGPRRKRKKRH